MRLPRLAVWPPLPLTAYLGRARTPFPLDDRPCVLNALGRHGLWHGVRALGLAPGDEVLVPAYHHGSEIEALAQAGLECRFYETSETLEPVAAELEAALTPRTRALLLIHYIGFPQDSDRWRRWCDERNVFLLEDAAQAWLSSTSGRPVGSFGDLSIFCLYKTFGLPDGSALVLRNGVDVRVQARPRLGLATLARRHAAWVMSRSGTLAGLGTRIQREGRDGKYSPKEDFELGDPASRPSSATLFLLGRVADRDAAQRRRDNYAFLLERLADLVLRPFDRVPEGASPFFFPVVTGRKRELLDWLRPHGVDALDFWSAAHPLLPSSGFPRARALRTQVVGLPVHQELRPQDLERVVETVLSWRPSTS
jgi:dTDP-4-amino-4,6-dideoxygalactose transaminase